MKFTYEHNNINVFDLEKSIKFYQEALNMKESVAKKRIEASDGSFIIVYMEPETGGNYVELTWLRDWDKPYNLGDNEFHMAFRTDDYEGAYNFHKEMGCIVYENNEMGLYFIADPDGYWIEVLPYR